MKNNKFHCMVDTNAADDALGSGTPLKIALQGTPCRRFLSGSDAEVVGDGYFRNAEDAAHILDVTFDIGTEALPAGRDIFYDQRRGQCAHHSGADGPHYVIEGGGMFFNGIDTRELLNAAVDTVVEDGQNPRSRLPGQCLVRGGWQSARCGQFFS